MSDFLSLGMAFLGVIFFLIWMADFFYWRRKNELSFPWTRPLPSWGGQLFRYFLFFVGTIAFVFLIKGWSTPKMKVSSHNKNYISNDLFILVDVSRSMLANDFTPNRIDLAKKQLMQFLEMRPSDRMGIILFSERILTLVPLTSDFNVLKESVHHISVGPLGDGTNIGDALALAVAKLKKSTAFHRSILLLTDGVGQVESMTPRDVSELARKESIQIYTIGMGKDDKALIPISSSIGGYYSLIPGGGLDEDLLQSLAQTTGGRFFRAVDGNGLKEIFSILEQMQKNQRTEEKAEFIYHENAYPFFFIGIVLLLFVETIRRLTLKEIL